MKRSWQKKLQKQRDGLHRVELLKAQELCSAAPARYDEWLDYYFGRYGRDSDDEWDMDWHFDAKPQELAHLFIHTLTNCGRDLAPFSDGQVAIGLQALLFSNFSDIPHTLMDGGTTEAARLVSIGSFVALYRDLLDRRAPPVLGHLNETQNNPLEYVTYMLWDVSPFDVMAARTEAGGEALLQVLAGALRLRNDACIESALHGLGHLNGALRGRAAAAIGDWLEERPQVRPELLAYARAARSGCIL